MKRRYATLYNRTPAHPGARPNIMHMKKNDFEKYATSHLGISSHTLYDYSSSITDYVSPTIIEERQLNIATMDVFSRLMVDRIIFLGAPISDDVANIIQAQLLYLEAADSGKDIRIYINSPGGSVYAGLGIYDTMQLIAPSVSTICTGMAASMAAVLLAAGEKGKRTALPHSRSPRGRSSSSSRSSTRFSPGTAAPTCRRSSGTPTATTGSRHPRRWPTAS